MNYTTSFGSLRSSPKTRPGAGTTFGLAVLGDFSAGANRGRLETGDQLAARKPRRVDVDNLDDVLASMQLRLSLPIGDDGGAAEVEIGSMDDFHPDELYENVELFTELAGLRRRVQKEKTFSAAAEEIRSWGAPAGDGGVKLRPKPRGAAVPNAKLSDFARLMGAATATEATPADELIKQVVRPYVTATPDPEQSEMVASVDAALSGVMRRLLHHPDFQAIESLWRSVEMLVRELETDGSLQIVLYDISAEEIAADLSSTDNLEETGLYKLLVEQPELDTRTTPPSAIVGAYTFEKTPPHADLLGRMAQVAAAAGAPFLAAIGADALVKKKPEEIPPPVAESWDALRALPHAAYLGLTAPRFMLRWPYGKKTEPIDPFDFEEFTPGFGLKGFLWGNGAVLAGLLLGKTFTQQGMPAMKLGSVMNQGELPFYYYTDADGDQIALPCTERLVPESVATHVISQGFIPLVWMKGRPEVRLGGFGSLAGSLLAGPWAPAGMPAAKPAAPEPAAEEPAAAVEDDEPAADSDDLDGLLGGLDEDSADGDSGAADEPEDSSDDDADDDLDALLSSLETEETDNEDADDDMDPELAALLADL